MKLNRPTAFPIPKIGNFGLHAATSSGVAEAVVESPAWQEGERSVNAVWHRTNFRERTGSIGIVFSDAVMSWRNHPLILAYTLGVEQACRERGYHFMMEMGDDPTRLPRCVADRKVDGLLVKSSRGAPGFLAELAGSFPIVGMGFNDSRCAIDQVATNDRLAGWLVTQYLWQQGHRRIGFVCVASDHPMFIARYQGYESYLRRERAYRPEQVFIDYGAQCSQEPEETMPDLTDVVDRLESVGMPSAIIAANDWVAGGLYEALKKRGWRIPEDVSVVGFDNGLALCGTLAPQLTSYDLSFHRVGRAAALRLLDQIGRQRGPDIPSVQLIHGHLVERASVCSHREMNPLPASLSPQEILQK
jgi:LacI family transcriptional regulator